MAVVVPKVVESATWSIEDLSVPLYRELDDAKPEAAELHSDTTQSRWAVILAGGDGVRLRSLAQLMYGDDRPKQFCQVFGRHTLLEQTRQRAAKSIPGRQTIIALTESHKKFYEHELEGSNSLRLVQPCNRGTAPPIILSLLHIASQAPDALVSLLPSDHYFSDEAAFTASLESAFQIADARQDSVVLLGAQPKSADVELGWIALGSSAGENVFRVRGFEEKPNREIAEFLLESGALWNTFVMVGSVLAFLWIVFVSFPELLSMLEESLPSRNEMGDLCVSPSLYDGIPTTDFSRQVLTPNAHRLLALRLRRCEWHDLGHPDRVLSVVRSQGKDLQAWTRNLGYGVKQRSNPGLTLLKKPPDLR